jgi:hypothetical protein
MASDRLLIDVTRDAAKESRSHKHIRAGAVEPWTWIDRCLCDCDEYLVAPVKAIAQLPRTGCKIPMRFPLHIF